VSGGYLTRAERRALEQRVAHLPVERADAIVDRACGSPDWARLNGWTRPLVDTANGERAVAS
jgi:hypothetical protein